MTKLIFITHPSVVISSEISIDEWPLSDKGVREADSLLRRPFWNEVQAVYASTEPKAYTVAEMIQKQRGLSYEKVEAIKEIDRSSTGLLPYDEYMKVAQEFYSKPHENVRGWESAEHARQRMKMAMTEIMQKHPGEIVAVIGHGATGTLLACEIKGISSSFKEDPKQTGCLMEIDWDKKVIISPWEVYSEGNEEVRREVMGGRLR